MNEETREPPPSPLTPADTPGTAAAAREQPRTAPPKAARLPPFPALLHNDNVNGRDHVGDTIVELTPHGLQRATSIMLEAHTTGLALLLVTHRERAELYADQFKSRNLTVTYEPAE